MTQTISIVRGNTTVTGDNSTRVVLFTNSATGFATRVIPNYFTIGSNNSIIGSSSGYLELINQAQATTFGIIAYHFSSPASSGEISLFPQNSTTQTTIANINNNTTNSRQFYSGQFISNGAIPEAFGATTSGSRGSFMPSNFYIGPSDQLRVYGSARAMQGKSNTPQTITVRYSFTLITES